MKAIVQDRYGPPEVLELREVDRPTPSGSEVLVRVHASSVGGGDWHLLSATWFVVRLFWGLVRPRRGVLGFDVAGTVEAVGPKVARFRPGDEVFGVSDAGGCFAEYVAVPENALAPRPPGLSAEQAAAVSVSAVTALHGLRDVGRIRAGQRVLVNGASGGVGTWAVQLARAFGAEVTGVASASKLDFVRSLGATHVLDHRQVDFTQRPERYDVVLDMVGNRALADLRRTLTPQGIYVAVSGHPLRALWLAVAGGKRMRAFLSKPSHEDLAFLSGLLERGEAVPVVDRCFPLEEVPAAMRYFGEGRARGKVVVRVRGNE